MQKLKFCAMAILLSLAANFTAAADEAKPAAKPTLSYYFFDG